MNHAFKRMLTLLVSRVASPIDNLDEEIAFAVTADFTRKEDHTFSPHMWDVVQMQIRKGAERDWLLMRTFERDRGWCSSSGLDAVLLTNTPAWRCERYCERY